MNKLKTTPPRVYDKIKLQLQKDIIGINPEHTAALQKAREALLTPQIRDTPKWGAGLLKRLGDGKVINY